MRLAHPLRPKDHAAKFADVIPPKHSPIRANGDGNQGVYLAAIPDAMASLIRQLLDGQVEATERKLWDSTGPELADEAAEQLVQQRTDIGPTEKLRLVKARLGQGVYRDNLELIEKGCRVTGVLDRRHLRASHIKPWRLSDDREKLDGFNGLLLSPHLDHLFDRGYISFSDEGDLLVASGLDPAVLERWGLILPANVGPFKPEQRVYLAHHRQKVFEKQVSGRGAQ